MVTDCNIVYSSLIHLHIQNTSRKISQQYVEFGTALHLIYKNLPSASVIIAVNSNSGIFHARFLASRAGLQWDLKMQPLWAKNTKIYGGKYHTLLLECFLFPSIWLSVIICLHFSKLLELRFACFARVISFIAHVEFSPTRVE